MLKNVLIRTVEQRILSLFAANPDRSFYSRELSKKINISLGAASNSMILREDADYRRTFSREGSQAVINSAENLLRIAKEILSVSL